MSDKKPSARRGAGRGKSRTQAETAPPGPQSSDTAEQSSGERAAPVEEGVARGRIRGKVVAAASAALSIPTLTEEEATEDTGRSSPDKDYGGKKKQLQAVFADRPGYGGAGNSIRLETNYFRIKMPDKAVKVFQYDVLIDQQLIKLTREDTRRIFWKVVIDNPAHFPSRYDLAYDGQQTLFAVKQLPSPVIQSSVEVRLARSGIVREYKVTVKLVAEIDFDLRAENNLKGLQYLDVLCRQSRSLYGTGLDTKWYVFGPATYLIPRGNPVDLGGGCDLWHGLFSSAHVGGNYFPLLNGDVANGVFYHYKLSVVQLLVDILNEGRRQKDYDESQLSASTQLNRGDFDNFRKAVTGLRVATTHRGESRDYHVRAVLPSAVEATFPTEQGVQNVAAYFQSRYGALKYPKLPALSCGSKKKPAYFPIEICYVVHPQRRAKQLSETQLSNMIKATALPAPDRRNRILAAMREANLNEDPWLTAHNIEIAKDMTIVPGRLLPPSKVQYNPQGCRNRTGPVVEPRNGEWSLDGQKVFQAAAPLGTYGVLYGRRLNQQTIRSIFPELRRAGEDMGLQIASEPAFALEYDHNNIEQQMTTMAKNLKPNSNNLKFVFVVVEKKSSSTYAEVKRVAEIITGVMSQCILFKTVQNIANRDVKSRQTSQNLILKINAKMGGINNRLFIEGVWKTLTDEKNCTLFVGADVSHPPPFDKVAPSVAAVVSNVDFAATRYSASIQVQKHRRETYMNLYEPIRQRLLAFNKETKAKPTRLVVYREGVAESQFQEVLNSELANIREACAALDAEYRPKVTFIVATKRHHTRFFCTNRTQEVGRSHNVPPGTMVDSDITNPRLFDFYLCSHMGIQGTSRPIRCTVLFDENKFSADEIQAMTYGLSNVYCRCTRSVSIPTPLYYAHWACLRAKHHLASKVSDFGSETMSEAGGGSAIESQELAAGVLVTPELQTQMYFV